MPSVLFVCTGNMHRSPLAAAFLRALLEQRDLSDWIVESAGTWTVSRQSLPPEAVRYAQLLGLDLSAHTTRVVTRDLLRNFDLILVMERGQKEALMSEFPEVDGRVFQLSEMLAGTAFDIPDPVLSASQRERVLHDMLNVIERGFLRITELAMTEARSRT